MKLDAEGNLIWAASSGGEGAELARSIALGPDGSVYTTGYSENADYYTNVFVFKLDAEGNSMWLKTVGGDDADEGAGIAVDGDGNVFVAGYFSGTADFDPGENVYNITVADTGSLLGNKDAFVLKLDAEGNFLWVTGMDAHNADALNDIAVAADGSVYAVGNSLQIYIWQFDPSPIPFFPSIPFPIIIGGPNGGCIIGGYGSGSFGSDYPFLDPVAAGSPTPGDPGSVSQYIGVDLPGTVTTSAVMQEASTTEADSIELALGTGLLVVKLDSAGHLVWSHGLGDAGSGGAGVTIGHDGNLYATGTLVGDADFGASSASFFLDGGDGSAFVSVLNPDGEFVRAYLAGSPDDAAGLDVAVAADGAVYVSGLFSNTIDFDPSTNTFNLGSTGDADFFLGKYQVFDGPTDISLSDDSVGDGQPVGTIVGVLSSAGLLSVADYTYSLVEGDGSDDNGSFVIVGNELITDAVVDAAGQDSYSIRVRSNDYAGQFVEQVFVISVVDLTAPTVSIGEPSAETTEFGPVTFIVTYNDANFDASTLTAADVTLISTGTATGTIAVDDGTGNARVVTISDISGDGTLSIAIAVGTAADLAGNLAPAAGPSAAFDVVSTPHRIDGVVVAEAGTNPKNNSVLESTDKLLITWAVRGINVAPAESLLVDGNRVQALFGPYMSADGAYMYAATFGPLAAGTYSFTIQSLDEAKGAASYYGSFDVAAAEVAGPAVANVIVAEAGSGSDRDGVKESTDRLVITWRETGEAAVSTRSLKIDDKAVTAVGGPNAAGCCYSVFGPLDAGEHAYTIEITDANGATSNVSGTFDVTAAEVAGPAVVNVVVAEAGNGSDHDGVKESTDKLVLTWHESSDARITARSLKIDDKMNAGIGGPNAAGCCYSVFGPLDAGAHSYTVKITDANGVSATETGTFIIADSDNSGPEIGHVVVAETAGLPRDGLLTTAETLVLSWTLTDTDGIAAKSLSVDGTNVSPIYGPYGNAYSGRLGQLTQGTHHYTIHATDTTGQASTLEGTFEVYAALTLDASPATTGSAESLTDAGLASIAAAAMQRLEAMLGSGVSTALSGVSVQLADLPGNLLGAATDGKILIDRDAAGHGWFVDATPDDDAEFSSGLAISSAGNSVSPVGRADLLTAVMHEFGHVLGSEHVETGLMDGLLPLGTRRTDAADAVFARFG